MNCSELTNEEKVENFRKGIHKLEKYLIKYTPNDYKLLKDIWSQTTDIYTCFNLEKFNTYLVKRIYTVFGGHSPLIGGGEENFYCSMQKPKKKPVLFLAHNLRDPLVSNALIFDPNKTKYKYYIVRYKFYEDDYPSIRGRCEYARGRCEVTKKFEKFRIEKILRDFTLDELFFGSEISGNGLFSFGLLGGLFLNEVVISNPELIRTSWDTLRMSADIKYHNKLVSKLKVPNYSALLKLDEMSIKDEDAKEKLEELLLHKREVFVNWWADYKYRVRPQY